MTAVRTGLNVAREVAAITAALAARRDSAYEWGMRRMVPSAQPAHATRVPNVRAAARPWRGGRLARDPVLSLSNGHLNA